MFWGQRISGARITQHHTEQHVFFSPTLKRLSEVFSAFSTVLFQAVALKQVILVGMYVDINLVADIEGGTQAEGV
jgi:hypothetical protein